MTVTELAVVAAAILIAAFVQSISGFGFALLSMPIMTLALPVERAVVISALLGTLSSSWLAIRGRAAIDRLVARRLLIAAYVGMPVGLVLLETVDDRVLRIGLGVAVLVATLLLLRRIDLAHVGAPLDAACGLISGVLNTSLSTNGPPLVFALQARKMPPATFRATISVVFMLSNLGGLVLFAIAGKFTVSGVVGAAIACPAWGLGVLLGAPVQRHVHGERFRLMVLGLLATAGVLAIVAAL